MFHKTSEKYKRITAFFGGIKYIPVVHKFLQKERTSGRQNYYLFTQQGTAISYKEPAEILPTYTTQKYLRHSGKIMVSS